MLLTKSTFVALVGAVAVAAEVPSPSFPGRIGAGPSGKSVYMADDFTISNGGSFTLVPTVTTHAGIQTTTKIGDAEPNMPDHTPHPSWILTGTATANRDSLVNSKNVSKTASVTGSFIRLPIMPIVTANGTVTKPTGTATPGNGTNHTTSATPTLMPNSLGSAFSPYAVTYLAFMAGFLAMAL
ncbi:hypothetical protein C7212DRAFT_325888 [Tuber magnatum]|uniref:Uncharacterized protein n=1 Tax=Tuber magnatum TaxID=42249 RepID=A0A317SMV8_9PEZI|nr:hypothetical protein C7212DRAFT_325888 [Tuber magnatum]